MVKTAAAAQMGFVLGIALFGAALFALPGFAPEVEARETSISTTSDRLGVSGMSPIVQIVPIDCAKEVWPALTASCLKTAPGHTVAAARLVTAKR